MEKFYRLRVVHKSTGIFYRVVALEVNISVKCCTCKTVTRVKIDAKDFKIDDKDKICQCGIAFGLKPMPSGRDETTAVFLAVGENCVMQKSDLFDTDVKWAGLYTQNSKPISFTTKNRKWDVNECDDNLKMAIGSVIADAKEAAKEAQRRKIYSFGGGYVRPEPEAASSSRIPGSPPPPDSGSDPDFFYCDPEGPSPHSSHSSEDHCERFNIGESDDIEDIQKEIEDEERDQILDEGEYGEVVEVQEEEKQVVLVEEEQQADREQKKVVEKQKEVVREKEEDELKKVVSGLFLRVDNAW